MKSRFALTLFLIACGSSSEGTPAVDASPAIDAAPTQLTYWQDVRPIFDAKCVGCHQEGGIAPFRLDEYETARQQSDFIRDAVVTRFMPPWLADDDCTDYAHDRSLTDAQIETIRQWSLSGALEGDPARPGPPIQTEISGLSRADVNLALPVPYEMKPQPDDYRCFVLDWPETEKKYITGFRANPGNAQVVHHVIAFLAPPAQVEQAQALDAGEEGQGYTCFGGPGFQASWVGAWAPGSPGVDFAAGSGLEVEPGSKIVLQVHYNSANGGGSDQSSVDFKVDGTVEKVARLQPWANPAWLSGEMVIPAGEADVKHSWDQDLTVMNGFQPLYIHSVGFHQHTRGLGGRVEIVHADGTRECLLDIPRWDFHWQGAYALEKPRRFVAGDKIHLECHWDNSMGDKDLNWGEGTDDEMCLTSFYFTGE
jgi:hypothetical protein